MQGTDVITLLNTVHYDPSQFLKPKEFNPEHFLDVNMSFKKSPAFMPFSAGESGGGQQSVFLANIPPTFPKPNSTLQTLLLLHPTQPSALDAQTSFLLPKSSPTG